MFADGFLQKLCQRRLEVVGLFQLVGKLHQLIGHSGVEHDVGACDGEGGAERTELELVAGEGERRGAVAVGGVLREVRQHLDANLHLGLFLLCIGSAFFDSFKNIGQFVAQEHRNDGRRRFVRAQAMIVARRGDGNSQQILMLIHSLDHRAQEQQELRVFKRRGTGLQQVLAVIGGNRPVVVLAGTVDARKGLFMQQAHHVVMSGDLFHDLHRQLVVVGGDVCGAEDRRQLVLCGCDLVVLGLGQHAQLPQFFVQFLHISRHAGLDRAEVMIVQLLTLGRLCAEERAAGVDQIATLFINGFVNQEILLLRADGRDHALGSGVAEELQDAHRLIGKLLHRAQQRGLFVQRLAAVGTEGRGNAQRAVLDKGVGGGIPGSVAAGFKGRAQTTAGEGRSVRLALDQLLAGELHDHAAVGRGADEGIVLFGSDAGHGLEPVGEMRHALFSRPVLHGVGHHVGHGNIQWLAVLDGLAQSLVGFLGQTFAHRRIAENHAAEQFRYALHNDSSSNTVR